MSYPLRFPDDDPRFTAELIAEIGAVLTAHGYPPIGDDTAFAGLRETLCGFLYGPAFNSGDKVTWICDGNVWSGRIDAITNTDQGQVARILTSPQPGFRHLHAVTDVVPCRELTLVAGGS